MQIGARTRRSMFALVELIIVRQDTTPHGGRAAAIRT
jgi:hypothetical protein